MSDAIRVYRPTGWGHEITMIAMRPGDIVPGSDYVLYADHTEALSERDERIAALEAEKARLSAPVTDAEWLRLCAGDADYIQRSDIENLMAARKGAA